MTNRLLKLLALKGLKGGDKGKNILIPKFTSSFSGYVKGTSKSTFDDEIYIDITEYSKITVDSLEVVNTGGLSNGSIYGGLYLYVELTGAMLPSVYTIYETTAEGSNTPVELDLTSITGDIYSSYLVFGCYAKGKLSSGSYGSCSGYCNLVNLQFIK